MKQAFEDFCNEGMVRKWITRLVGNGTGNPTLGGNSSGFGYTATRAGAAGDLKVTFKENPGKYLGTTVAFQSATGTDLKNFSAIVKDYDSTNFVVEVLIFNAGGTATDLTTAQSLTMVMHFKETGV